MGKTRWGQFFASEKASATSTSPTTRGGIDGSTTTGVGGTTAPCAKEGEATDWSPRPPVKNDNDHFQKLMDLLCQNHDFPICHKFWECELLKSFISKPPAKKAKQEDPSKQVEQEILTEDLPKVTGCLMIFGWGEAYGDRCHHKAA